MLPAPGLGRIRKSPENHHLVGSAIRNPALRCGKFPQFPQPFTKKEKEPKRKKSGDDGYYDYRLLIDHDLNYKGSAIEDRARGGHQSASLQGLP